MTLLGKDLPAIKNIKILLVDDDPVILTLMASILRKNGYQFASASDGLEAVKKLEQDDTFRIVITDINMPRMNGMELLKHILEFYPQTAVIVTTGFSREYSYMDVIKAGAIDYMTKPFDTDELLAKLHRVIREQTMVEQLEKMSISDGLTSLYNRRYFDLKIMEEIHRSSRHHYRIFLAFIDIDNFKSFNDEYGHQAGDEVLQTLGSIMLNCARRGGDWAFRYGGDEFAMLLTETSEEQALMICERINSSYKENNFGSTSLSFGLGEFHRHEELDWYKDMHLFLKKTDDAMYKAKKGGKNKIVIAD
ncbi:MAG TPA: diguanylate cyclase [Desulfobacterales bacterium]|nr:diguanylate cyclase [Desulfobacterales bacterium]